MRKLALAFAAVAALAWAPAAHAGGEVTTTADSGPGSLRDALSTPGTVTFQPGLGTIELSSTIAVANAATITGPATVAGASPVLDFASGSNPSTVTGVSFDGGVKVDVAGVKIQASPIFDAVTPIQISGGTAAPAALKVGPRQANGSLPLSGTVAAAGSVDAYSGSPFGSSFLGAASASAAGSFSFPLTSDPTPGGKIAATLTTGSTSAWSATADVPADITSPTLAAARALTTGEVVITPSEPLSVPSVGVGDFSLTMAGSKRTITQGGIEPDGSRIYLLSSQPWRPGDAGSVSLTAAGAITDPAGNFSSSTAPIVVGAAPGDFQAPVITGLKLKPSRICLTKTGRCKHPGVTITFTIDEPARIVFTVDKGSNRRAGTFVKRIKTAGVQRIKWGGSVKRGKLRAGRYLIEVVATDSVGNTSDDPPFKTFTVIRSTG